MQTARLVMRRWTDADLAPFAAMNADPEVMRYFPAPFPAHFTPAVEVGWRLARAAWGQCLATEAAHKALDVGLGDAQLPEIVSMTARTNQPSQRVMRRLGMTHDPADDFDHPQLAEGHPLRAHVLYRISPVSHISRGPS